MCAASRKRRARTTYNASYAKSQDGARSATKVASGQYRIPNERSSRSDYDEALDNGHGAKEISHHQSYSPTRLRSQGHRFGELEFLRVSKFHSNSQHSRTMQTAHRALTIWQGACSLSDVL
ncbi:hypothetical protein PUN28_018155 [Cardiocondyla obscurior]|uniref:Uncharacterized protein n=1 Tax=Cardiocondyla obscurior TaxID=286306 RepID=A0AAW2EG35_9HYME